MDTFHGLTKCAVRNNPHSKAVPPNILPHENYISWYYQSLIIFEMQYIRQRDSAIQFETHCSR